VSEKYEVWDNAVSESTEYENNAVSGSMEYENRPVSGSMEYENRAVSESTEYENRAVSGSMEYENRAVKTITPIEGVTTFSLLSTQHRPKTFNSPFRFLGNMHVRQTTEIMVKIVFRVHFNFLLLVSFLLHLNLHSLFYLYSQYLNSNLAFNRKSSHTRKLMSL
jgi:hypothetical protein